MNLVYEFDEQGRIVGIDENGSLRRYGYSRLGLTMAQDDGAMYRFDYDSTGNRRASPVQGNDGSLAARFYRPTDSTEPRYQQRLDVRQSQYRAVYFNR